MNSKIFSVFLLLCCLSANLSFGFVLKQSKANSAKNSSIPVDYCYIQNVKSGLVVAAFDNGFPTSGPDGSLGFATAESLNDAHGNKTIESMLAFHVEEEKDADYIAFKTMGKNDNNDFGIYYFSIFDGITISMTKFWLLKERGNNTYQMSPVILHTPLSSCVADVGLHRHLDDYQECNDENAAQEWRFVKAEGWSSN